MVIRTPKKLSALRLTADGCQPESALETSMVRHELALWQPFRGGAVVYLPSLAALNGRRHPPWHFGTGTTGGTNHDRWVQPNADSRDARNQLMPPVSRASRAPVALYQAAGTAGKSGSKLRRAGEISLTTPGLDLATRLRVFQRALRSRVERR